MVELRRQLHGKLPEYMVPATYVKLASMPLVEIGPGDMLFIPLFWWHAVHSLGENLAVNFWWKPARTELLRHPRQAARGLSRQVFTKLRGVKRALRAIRS